jgi:hypothetical protein
MPNFGLPRRSRPDALNGDTAPINWRRGLFRSWVLASVGWIMSWLIYFAMDGFQGGISSHGDMAAIPVVLFAPPVALWLFGMAAAWAVRGFEQDRTTNE